MSVVYSIIFLNLMGRFSERLIWLSIGITQMFFLFIAVFYWSDYMLKTKLIEEEMDGKKDKNQTQ